jgi:RimJ/RimL family protein N-acetyltransferase
MGEKIPGPAYRIHTPRLVLRCWSPADAVLIQDALVSSIDHLMPFMPWADKEPVPLQERIGHLRSFRSKFDLGQEFIYGVFDQDEARALGGSGLHTRGQTNVLEIGYWIRKDATNQGYATELSMALTKVAFEIHNIHRLEIRCNPTNVYSAAIPRRLGFTHEGTLRKNYAFRGDFTDTMVWSLLDDEYPSSPSASVDIKAFDAIDRQLL